MDRSLRREQDHRIVQIFVVVSLSRSDADTNVTEDVPVGNVMLTVFGVSETRTVLHIGTVVDSRPEFVVSLMFAATVT